MFARRIRMCFSAAALVLALVGIAVRLKPLWHEAPGIRECFLIAFDGMIVFGAVWAAGWALARSYQIDDQRRAPKPSTPSPFEGVARGDEFANASNSGHPWRRMPAIGRR
jgi:hypothetical protein